MKNEYYCKHCNHSGPVILDVIGLLCERCKRILFRHGSSEWNSERNIPENKKDKVVDKIIQEQNEVNNSIWGTSFIRILECYD